MTNDKTYAEAIDEDEGSDNVEFEAYNGGDVDDGYEGENDDKH